MSIATGMSKRDTAVPDPRAPAEITVVCQVFHPDTQSTSQLLSDVIAGLSERDWKVTVLAGYPGMKGGEKAEFSEVWKNTRIRRGGMRAQFKRNLALRAFAYLSYSWFVTWRLISLKAGSRVFIVTNPPFAPVIGWLVCRLRGHSFVVMLQDIYPDGLTALNKLPKNGAI